MQDSNRFDLANRCLAIALILLAVGIGGDARCDESNRSANAAQEHAEMKTVYRDDRGHVLVGDSLTYVREPYPNDIVISGSFAGVPTIAIALRQGVKGVIAHEAGIGKNKAGIAGLALADRYKVPAAAVKTMSAKIADGNSLAAGVIGQVNDKARKLGVTVGMPTLDAAKLMLDAPKQSPRAIDAQVDESLHEMESVSEGKVIATWSILLAKGPQSKNVFCVASHSGETMARFALQVQPKGIIANDAGMAMEDSGVAGLAMLDEHNIAAASVDCMTAEIGNGLSTYRDGIVSAVNKTATAAGVSIGMPARHAAHLMLKQD